MNYKEEQEETHLQFSRLQCPAFLQYWKSVERLGQYNNMASKTLKYHPLFSCITA